MNLEKLKEQLKIDEGVKYCIYLDTHGLPTCGIGHLITKDDAEFGLPIGTKISAQRVDEFFEKDIQRILKECKKLFENFDEMQEEVKQVIANMIFNLGLGGLSKFKKFIQALKNGDFKTAAAEMENSLWFKQVGDRSKRLQNRILKLAGDKACKNCGFVN